MKKLKLKALELGAREVLNREQLKHVLGGFDDGSGSGKTGSGNKCSTSCTKGGHYHVCDAVVTSGTPSCKCPVDFATSGCH